MKICTKCGVKKPFDKFNKNHTFKDGYCYQCKDCVRIERIERKTNNPWIYTFYALKRRCNDKNHDHYKSYGGRGIKCLITVDELKNLWFRDKAHEMLEPSIDRKDNNGNYTFDNCRYKELNLNVGERNSRILSKSVIQKSLDDIFIKEFSNLTKAAKATNQTRQNIGFCINGKTKTAGGFKWFLKT